MTNLDDTQPQRAVRVDYERSAAPPRILLWGVIVLFFLGIIGVLTSVYIFREVLLPGQQVRVMGYLPFMEAFLPPRPDADDTVPTARAVDSDAAQNLLNSPLNLPGGAGGTSPAIIDATAVPTATLPVTAESTDELEATEEATEEVALEVAAVTTAIPTNTPQPTTQATPEQAATEVVSPTDVPQAETVTAAENTRTWSSTAYNTGFVWDQQDWNNCGPANITMALSYYGWTRDQAYAASFIRPNDEDKNVSPHELVSFVNEQSDINALVRMGGDLDLLRTLVDNEFPVIIERSHMFEGYAWLGHYQTIVGYSDPQNIFFIYDTFLGTGEGNNGTIETYQEVDEGWQAFNRTFIVVYPPGREDHLMQLLDSRANPLMAAEHAFEVAQEEARSDPENSFAWFNMGTSLTELERYQEATVAFDKAIQLGIPWRMLWYQFGPFEANYEVGRYEDILRYVDSNLSNGGEYVEETYYWQARALAAQGETSGAISAVRTALRRNPSYAEAQSFLDQLT